MIPKFIAAVLIILISFGVYFNSLQNGFVYDDKALIVDNPLIKDVKHIPQLFSSEVWGGIGEEASNYYRPLMYLIYMTDYYIFGLNPWGFHLTNIIFHAGVSVLVFLIALMLAGSGTSFVSALVAGILFAVHPVHTEAVAWTGGLPDISFSFFYLLSFYLYARAGRFLDVKYLLSVFIFLMALLCKEPALTLPVFFLIYEYLYGISSKSLSLRSENMKAAKHLLPFAVTAGIYFILRTNALGGFVPSESHAWLGAYGYFINIFPLFVNYIVKLILPVNLCAYHVFYPVLSILEIETIISLILTIVCLFLVYVSRKEKETLMSAFLIMLPLIPALYIPALGENAFAERYLYLPSAGFAMLAAIGTEKLLSFRKTSRDSVVLLIALIAVSIFYSVVTVNRNVVWKDEYSLWTDTVKKSPDGAVPHNNLGIAYRNEGMIDDAIEQYKSALSLRPDYSDAHYNLAVAYHIKGMSDKAIEQYEIALTLKPDNPYIHNNLGVAYKDNGMIEKALEHFNEALRLNPGLSVAQKNINALQAAK